VIVYHGSYTEIDKIDLSMAKLNKDFGRGFYVTSIRKQAEVWADIQGKFHGTDGVVTEFWFNGNVFDDSDYNCLRFSEYNDDWFDFVIKNRNKKNEEEDHGYDIVEGPVADDNVSRKIVMYLNGKINREKFFRELSKYPFPSHQICLCTVNSLRSIDKEGLNAYYDKLDESPDIVEKVVEDGVDKKVAVEKYFMGLDL